MYSLLGPPRLKKDFLNIYGGGSLAKTSATITKVLLHKRRNKTLDLIFFVTQIHFLD